VVAERAEPAALAGKGQQVLVLAMVAADAGEAALEITAFQEFVDYLGDNGAQQPITGLVRLGINLLELIIVAAGALPQR
jgi:hypothetical protein